MSDSRLREGARESARDAARDAAHREGSGRYAYEGLDRMLHEKARLGILTSLLPRGEGLTFVELKRLCALTDGNLSRHIQALHDAGLVEVKKGVERNRPQTRCRLTALGRRRFVEYLGELERVIRDALPAARPARARDAKRDLPDGPPEWVPA